MDTTKTLITNNTVHCDCDSAYMYEYILLKVKTNQYTEEQALVSVSPLNTCIHTNFLKVGHNEDHIL